MKPKPKSGSGAAHIGWMYGARGPLLAAVGSSPGGGAAAPAAAAAASAAAAADPAQPAQPAGPPAQGGAPAPQLDPAATRAAEQRGRDAAFAEMRRNGSLKKSAIAAIEAMDGQQPTQQPGQAGAAPTHDPSAFRTLDRAITKLGIAATLNEAQWRRVERDFQVERPSDPEAWLRDYFPGTGTAAPPVAGTTASAATAAPQNARPASGAAGSPARNAVPLENQNVLEMSEGDVANYVARFGVFKFKQAYTEALKGARIKLV